MRFAAEPSSKKISTLKAAALDLMDKGRQQRRAGKQRDLKEMCALVDELRVLGHYVELEVIDGKDMRKILVELARSKHARRKQKAKRKGAPRFGSCSVWELHSKSFCWCRSSATCAVCCC